MTDDPKTPVAPAIPVEPEKPVEPKPEVPPQVKPEIPEVKKEIPQATGPKGIAWDEALIFFCTPVNGKYPTLIDVAKKYGVGEDTVNKKSAEEKWLNKRKEMAGRKQEAFIQDRENLIKDANARHLKRWRKAQALAGSLFKMFETRVGKYREAQAKIETIKTGSAEEKKKIIETDEALNKVKLPSEHRLLSIINILKTSVEGERIVLGLPIIVSKTDVTSDGELVVLPPELIAEIDSLRRKNEEPTVTPDRGSNQ